MHASKPILLVAWGIGSTGCYQWVDIKPLDLTKLHGSYAQATGTVPAPSDTVFEVERPDGTLASIDPEFDAEVTTSRGLMWFNRPVESSIVSGQLAIRSGNYPPTTFALQDVTKVRVSQYEATKSWVTGSVLVGITAAILVVYVARASGSD